MRDDFRQITLTDAEQGEVKLLVVVSRNGDAWGAIGCLRGTPWGDQIPVVSGEVMSHALHGWATPLMREIGPAPRLRARRMNVMCSLLKSCVGASPKCRPGPALPDCYEPSGVSSEAALWVARIAVAWRDGLYVVVVEGPEFSLS